MKANGLETELKLMLACSSDHELLAQALGPPVSETFQTNTFYDTVDGSLGRRSLALRLRKETFLLPPGPDLHLLTLKGPAIRLGEAFRRSEQEKHLTFEELSGITRGELTFVDLLPGPLPDLMVNVSLEQMVPVVTFTNHRTSFSVRLGGGLYLLELDRTTFSDEVQEHEIEVELPSTAGKETVKRVSRDLERLLEDLGIEATRSATGKFSRALRHRSAMSKP